jgi:tRNA U34 5-carboxymethylaminomethyl modifying GTPase MnmE/TrmE
MNIVIIGANSVGKNSFLDNILHLKHDRDNLYYTFYNAYLINILVLDTYIEKKLKSADGIIYMYSLDDNQSYENFKKNYSMVNKDIPHIVIANKNDIADTNMYQIDYFKKCELDLYECNMFDSYTCNRIFSNFLNIILKTNRSINNTRRLKNKPVNSFYNKICNVFKLCIR